MDRGSAFEMFGEPVPPPQDTTEIELQETNPNTENGLYTTESSTVSEEQARTAFQNYVQRHHFYGRCAANDCVIDTIRCVDAFHYMLETFTEARSTKLIEQPYEGDTESDEGPDGTDSVPEPWDIEVEPQKLFENNSVHLPVPNSEQIKPCSNCLGSCKTTCSFCDGAGSAMCLSCGGEGSVKSNVKPADGEETKMEDCTTCDGKGRKGCSPCSESGEIGCSKCEAKGKLKTHLELIVIWKNNWDDYIVDYVGAVPEKVLRQLQGKIAFSEEKRKISPLSDFPNNDIVMASKELVEGHHSDFINQRILKQRHQVRVVPISDIKYTYKEKKLNFYVYGENRDNVYAPNYPQRYCCCSVM
ncbi:protein SSUH2 homolog [Glandiceps talaboti]